MLGDRFRSRLDPYFERVLEIVRDDALVPAIVQLDRVQAPQGATRAVGREVESFDAQARYLARIVPQVHVVLPARRVRDLAASPLASVVWYDRPAYAFDFSTFVGAQGPIRIATGAILGLDDQRQFVGADDVAKQFDAQGRGVKVGVVDTGIDDTHPMLEGAVVARESFAKDDEPGDPVGHATWVASSIAGRPIEYRGKVERKRGVTLQGMAPEAKLYDARALDKTGGGATSSVIQGLEWVHKQEVDIVNISLGSLFGEAGFGPDAQLVNELAKDGVRVVCASGNSFIHGSVGSPGSAAGSITVGSVAMRAPFSGAVASFSSKGPTSAGRVKPDVCGPGGNAHPFEVILGATSGLMAVEAKEPYIAIAGTSMAAPSVSGVLAQLVPLGFPSDRGKIETVLAVGSRFRGDASGFGATLPRLKNNRKGWGIADARGWFGAMRRNLPGLPVREVVTVGSSARARPFAGVLGFVAGRVSARVLPVQDPHAIRLTRVD